MCLSGGSGAWRFDGNPPESHGEVLPSCLVWESRDERPPPCDQKVSFPLLSWSSSCQACLCTSFSPVFTFCGCSGIKRGWHFPGSKAFQSFCVSSSPNKHRYVLESCYWTVLLDSIILYNVTSSPQTLVPDVWCIPNVTNLFKGSICWYL